MTQRLYLPDAGSAPRSFPFGDHRKIVFSVSRRLALTAIAAAQSSMASKIVTNKQLFNRAVSVHATRPEIGFNHSRAMAPEVADSYSAYTPLVLWTMPDILAPSSAGSSAFHASMLAKIKSVLGFDILALSGGADTGGSSFNFVDYAHCWISFNAGTASLGDGSFGTTHYRVPSWVISMILLKFDQQPFGDRVLTFDAAPGGPIRLYRYHSHGPIALSEVLPAANVTRAVAAGLVAPYTSTDDIKFNAHNLSGPEGLDDMWLPGVFAHGVYPGVTRMYFNPDFTEVVAVAGTLQLQQIAVLLQGQRPVVPAFQNDEFDTMVSNLKAQPFGLIQWHYYNELQQPVDLWQDPKLAAALSSPFVSNSDIYETVVGDKTLAEWREIMLVAPARRLFYRGVKPQMTPHDGVVDATYNGSVYVFTMGGSSFTPQIGHFYTVGNWPAGDIDAHISSADAQTGASFETHGTGAYSSKMLESMAPMNELSPQMRWLYTLSASLGIRELATSMATLATIHESATVIVG